MTCSQHYVTAGESIREEAIPKLINTSYTIGDNLTCFLNRFAKQSNNSFIFISISRISRTQLQSYWLVVNGHGAQKSSMDCNQL